MATVGFPNPDSFGEAFAPKPASGERNFERVVRSVEQATVLVLVY
jgi:hypothetical protein